MAVLVMSQLFTMIILMLVGVILNKKKYLSENGESGCSGKYDYLIAETIFP